MATIYIVGRCKYCVYWFVFLRGMDEKQATQTSEKTSQISDDSKYPILLGKFVCGMCSAYFNDDTHLFSPIFLNSKCTNDDENEIRSLRAWRN